jgi:hypothetical protein
MTNSSSSNATFSRGGLPIWLPFLTVLALSGLAAGYFWPPKASVTTESPAAPNSDGIDSPAASAPDLIQEFPLPAADVRDTQQAPSLAVGPDCQVYVSWESKSGEATKALMFTAAPNSTAAFEQPRVVAASGIFKSGGGSRGGHERRMLPRVASYGRTVAVAWSDAPADGSRVQMLLAESLDGGQSFGKPVVVHASTEARPTFIAMAANSQGRIAASWLDCRTGPQQVYAAVRPAADAEFVADSLVCAGQNDQGVCPCCPTASLVMEDGRVLVAYRGLADGYRDTWISQFNPNAPAKFSEPVAVVPPTWKFDGCPHDGPALAAAGEWLHVAWTDAHSGRQRAYFGRARLSDLKFVAQELNAAGPGTQGNVKLAINDSGGVHAVWEESLTEELPTDSGSGSPSGHQHALPTGAGRVIVHAYAPQGDGRFGPAQAVRPQPGSFQTRPAVACGAGGELVIAWTELDESGKRVVVVRRSLGERTALQPGGRQTQ